MVTAKTMERYDRDRAIDPEEWAALDEGERQYLVERYHRKKRIKMPNSRVHAAIHVVVENQVALGPKQARFNLDRGRLCFRQRIATSLCCSLVNDTTFRIEGRLPLQLRCLLDFMSAFDAPLSPFLSFAAASREIAAVLTHENLSCWICPNVEKNVSRCLL